MQDNHDKSRVYLGCNFAVLGYLRFMLSVAKNRQANEYDLISADGEIDLRYFSTTKAQPVAGIVIAPNANIAIVKKEAFQ
jgi:hypothetical protein